MPNLYRLTRMGSFCPVASGSEGKWPAVLKQERVINDGQRTVDKLTLIGGKALTVYYEAYHGYGRGPGLQGLMKRMLSGERTNAFTTEDECNCVNNARITIARRD